MRVTVGDPVLVVWQRFLNHHLNVPRELTGLIEFQIQTMIEMEVGVCVLLEDWRTTTDLLLCDQLFDDGLKSSEWFPLVGNSGDDLRLSKFIESIVEVTGRVTFFLLGLTLFSDPLSSNESMNYTDRTVRPSLRESSRFHHSNWDIDVEWCIEWCIDPYIPDVVMLFIKIQWEVNRKHLKVLFIMNR